MAKGVKEVKGFIISISTLLLASFLVSAAIFLQTIIQNEEFQITSVFAIEKAGFVADDIATDLNRMLGTSVNVQRNDSLTFIVFSDALPADLNKYSLQDYNAFVGERYAKQQNAFIQLNLEHLLDGRTELVFSNGLQYDYNYESDNSILFYKPNSDSNVVRFDINVAVNDSSVAAVPWNWSPNGDINVNLRFIDQNAENMVSLNGLLDSALENTYRWDYNALSSNDRFYIKVGQISGNAKALKIGESFDDSSTKALVRIQAIIPSPAPDLFWFYDADLNYVQSHARVFKKIELGRS